MNKHFKFKRPLAVVMAFVLALTIGFGLTASNVAYAYSVIGDTMAEEHKPEKSKEAWSTSRFQVMYPDPTGPDVPDITDKFNTVVTDSIPTTSTSTAGTHYIEWHTNTGTLGDERQATYTKASFDPLSQNFKIALDVDFMSMPFKGLQEGIAFGFFKVPASGTVADGDLGGTDDGGEPWKMAVYGNNAGLGALKNSLIIELDSEFDNGSVDDDAVNSGIISGGTYPVNSNLNQNAHNHIAVANPSSGLAPTSGYKVLAHGGADTLGNPSRYHTQDFTARPVDHINKLYDGLFGSGWQIDEEIPGKNSNSLNKVHRYKHIIISWEQKAGEYYLTYRYFSVRNIEQSIYSGDGGEILTLDFWKSSERATKTIVFSKQEVQNIFGTTADSVDVMFGVFSDNEEYRLSLPRVYDYSVNFYHALANTGTFSDTNPRHEAIKDGSGNFIALDAADFEAKTGRLPEGVYDFSDALPGGGISPDKTQLDYYTEKDGYEFARTAEFDNEKQYKTFINSESWKYYFDAAGASAAYDQLEANLANHQGSTDPSQKYYSLNYRAVAQRPFNDSTTDFAGQPEVNYFYVADVIKGSLMSKPDGYFEVTFKTDAAKGSFVAGDEVTYYVRDKLPRITLGNSKIVKPGVNAEAGFVHVGWDQPDDLDIDDNKEVNALYLPNIAKQSDIDALSITLTETQLADLGYVKVSFDTDGKGSLAPGIDSYCFVKKGEGIKFSDLKAAGVVPTVDANMGYDFKSWDMADDDLIPDSNVTVTAQYDEWPAVVPGNGGATPNPESDYYAKVVFEQGTNGTFSGGSETVYYVKKNALPTPLELGHDDIEKPTISSVDMGYVFTNWDKADSTKIVDANLLGNVLTVTAKYSELDDIIPDADGTNTKPTGYVTVNFIPGENGTLDGETIYYVNPLAGKKVSDLTAPTATPNDGYVHNGWDKIGTMDITDNLTIEAQWLPDIIAADEMTSLGVDETTLLGAPLGYVKVTIKSGEHGNFGSGDKVYYVKDKTYKQLIDKVDPLADLTVDDGYASSGWNQPDLDATITADSELVVQYNKDIIPSSKWPAGTTPGALYTTVTFENGGHADLNGETLYYVRKGANVKLSQLVKPDVVNVEDGYMFASWDKGDQLIPNTGLTVTAQFYDLENVIPESEFPWANTSQAALYAKVTFSGGDNGSLSGETVYYVRKAAKLTLADVPKPRVSADEDYLHIGWSLPNDKLVDGDLTVTARYRTYDSGGGEWIFVEETKPDPEAKPGEVTPVEETAYPVPAIFTKDHYAYVTGYPDGTVRPLANITRAEVSTIFFRLLIDQVRADNWTQDNDYSDVNIKLWFNNAVSVMSKMTKIMGYPDGEFKGNEPITRVCRYNWRNAGVIASV